MHPSIFSSLTRKLYFSGVSPLIVIISFLFLSSYPFLLVIIFFIFFPCHHTFPILHIALSCLSFRSSFHSFFSFSSLFKSHIILRCCHCFLNQSKQFRNPEKDKSFLLYLFLMNLLFLERFKKEMSFPIRLRNKYRPTSKINSPKNFFENLFSNCFFFSRLTRLRPLTSVACRDVPKLPPENCLCSYSRTRLFRFYWDLCILTFILKDCFNEVKYF